MNDNILNHAEATACTSGYEYLLHCDTPQQAWDKCNNPSWLLWALRKRYVKINDEWRFVRSILNKIERFFEENDFDLSVFAKYEVAILRDDELFAIYEKLCELIDYISDGEEHDGIADIIRDAEKAAGGCVFFTGEVKLFIETKPNFDLLVLLPECRLEKEEAYRRYTITIGFMDLREKSISRMLDTEPNVTFWRIERVFA